MQHKVFAICKLMTTNMGGIFRDCIVRYLNSLVNKESSMFIDYGDFHYNGKETGDL